MAAQTAVYGPADSPTVQRLVRYKKRFGWRVLVIDPAFWRSGCESVPKAVVDSTDSPIAKAYEELFERCERQDREYLEGTLGRKPKAKELAMLPKYEIKVVEFRPAVDAPATVIDLDGDVAARAAQNERLAKGFPPSKEGQEMIRKANVKRNTARQMAIPHGT